MIKFCFFLLYTFLTSSMASEFYQSYDYNDTHIIKTEMSDGIRIQKIAVNDKLHLHQIERNGTKYSIFWLQQKGLEDKNDIDKESVNAPFIIENNSSDGFKITQIKSLSKDRSITNRLIGVVDILQFVSNKEGLFKFINSMGSVEVNQTIEKQAYHLRYLKQYRHKKVRDNIHYLDTNISIITDNNVTYSQVDAKEFIKIEISSLQSTMTDKRVFTLRKSNVGLSKEHWFLQLSPDIKTWDFYKKPKLSRVEASKIFNKKQKQMKSLLANRKDFAQWVLDNMDFLSHLDTLLEDYSLEDNVSKKLFAFLGYVDTAKSSTVLSQVFLNKKIDDRERFRSLMGLKNTSAPIDEDSLDQLISYGLYSDDNDILQRASGMLLGSIAHHREERTPLQYEKISDAIVDAINTTQDKTVALNAAKNMKESASDSIVQSVEDVLLNDTNSLNRKKSAQALLQIKKSNLSVSDFRDIYDKESNSDTKADIIRSSMFAQDFKNSEAYRNFLISIAKRENISKSNKISALEVLDKDDFGQTDKEKLMLRNMMLNSRDRDVSQKMLKMYRK